MKIFQSGEYEGVKEAVHTTALGLVGLMAAWNLGALILRREPHLAFNVLIYGGLTFYEHKMVQRHKAHRRDDA